MSTYKAPKYRGGAFTCPRCNAYAKQSWSKFFTDFEEDEDYQEIATYLIALCAHCEHISIWEEGKMIFPSISDKEVLQPNEDLDREIQEDFKEASRIIQISPRGSAAISRLCLQKLCVQLGQKGKNLNDDIAVLVKNGLSPKVQKALDVVRVIGNNAVHPGEINLKDDSETAINLLKLINIIAEVMISQPKHIEALYDSLPEATLSAIEKRDNQ